MPGHEKKKKPLLFEYCVMFIGIKLYVMIIIKDCIKPSIRNILFNNTANDCST